MTPSPVRRADCGRDRGLTGCGGRLLDRRSEHDDRSAELPGGECGFLARGRVRAAVRRLPPASRQRATKSGPVMDEQTKATIDRIVAEQLKATGLAGLAGVVRIGDGIWRGSAGVSDLATKEPFRAGDFVRIASISKTYTATAVLQLVGEEKVALEDKLETYVPGVINGTVATIGDLLGMTSGIPGLHRQRGISPPVHGRPHDALVGRRHARGHRRGQASRLRAGGEGGLLRLQLRPVGDDHRRGHG